MKVIKLILSSLAIATGLSVSAQSIIPSLKENACQKDMRERGYGMFIHFGMNTFNGLEWSEGKDPATQ